MPHPTDLEWPEGLRPGNDPAFEAGFVAALMDRFTRLLGTGATDPPCAFLVVPHPPTWRLDAVSRVVEVLGRAPRADELRHVAWSRGAEAIAVFDASVLRAVLPTCLDLAGNDLAVFLCPGLHGGTMSAPALSGLVAALSSGKGSAGGGRAVRFARLWFDWGALAGEDAGTIDMTFAD